MKTNEMSLRKTPVSNGHNYAVSQHDRGPADKQFQSVHVSVSSVKLLLLLLLSSSAA